MTTAPAPSMPGASRRLDLLRGRSVPQFLWVMVVTGAVSTVAFDFYGQALSPILGFAGLAPVPLATQVVQVMFDVQGAGRWGHFLHYVAGMLAYPLGWLLVVEPVRRAFAPAVPWLAAAILYGAVLWVFALYIMAHLIAGNPAFLGFTGITWVALAGHVLFAVVTAVVDRAMERRGR